MKAVIFGASRLGEIAFLSLRKKYNIIVFCDNDATKKDTIFCGLIVISPEDLQRESYRNYQVIIASQYHLDIAKQLIALGINCFYLFELENKTFKISEFDYRNYSDFKVIKNKVALIIANNSGSNTSAILKLYESYDDFSIQFIKVDEAKKNNDYYYNIFTSSVIVRTHEGPYLSDKINIQLWHGFPLKGLSYMSKYSNQNKEYTHSQWKKIDKVFSYSTLYNVLMGACYGINGEKFSISGMPRNDLIFKGNGIEKLEKILKRNIKEKVILYLPTFRESLYGEKNGSENGYIFNFVNFDIMNFNDFLVENNCIFLLKLHPVDYKRFNINQLHKYSNIFGMEEKDFEEYDLYEILNSVDILITDYSSVYFDYLLLNRPIIFLDRDKEEYFESRGILLEPFDFWTPGPKVNNIVDLFNEIVMSLSNCNYYSSERSRICDLVHKYKDGESTKRIMDEIYKLIHNNA